jgi:hypothetical protein
MKSPLRKMAVIAGSLTLFFLGGLALWEAASHREPAFSGKRLSVWLDELARLDFQKRADTNSVQVKAVRAIGTNAIPWLLADLRAKRNPWEWRLNQLLGKQHLINFRFSDIDKRRSRATFGFEALGEAAAPAIPALLGMVEDQPGYVPSALAGIGAPALPALGQCLTNTRSYATSIGQFAPIPGSTIGALYNAINLGRISQSKAAFLLPTIRQWAQSTNQNAAWYAASFLKDLDR